MSATIDRDLGTYIDPAMVDYWPADPALKLRAGEAYSVTKILGILAKPALLGWAAKCEREAILEAVAAEGELYSATALAGNIGDLAILYPGKTPKLWAKSFAKRVAERVKPGAHKRVMTAASDLGNEAHKEIERRLKYGDPFRPSGVALSEHATLIVMAFEDWAREVKLNPIEVEQRVYGVTERFAGTLDCLAEVSGERAVIDWKSSKAIYPEMKLQLAAYASCKDSDAGYIVRLPKTLEDVQRMARPFEAVRLSDADLNVYYRKFLAVKGAFNAMVTA